MRTVTAAVVVLAALSGCGRVATPAGAAKPAARKENPATPAGTSTPLNINDPRSVLAHVASFKVSDTGNAVSDTPEKQQREAHLAAVTGKDVAWRVVVGHVTDKGTIYSQIVYWPESTLEEWEANDSRHHLSSLQVLATGTPLEQVRSLKRGDTVVVRGTTSAPASQGGTHGEKRFRDEGRTFVCGRTEITLTGCTVSAAR